MYKLAIVGSRRFHDYALMKEILDPYKDQINLIISGGARGADTLAQRYAKDNAIPITIYYPDYKKYSGKRAPVMRSLIIASRCDIMIAFAYPDSKGTRHAIRLAKEKKADVVVIELKEADR